MHLPSDIDAPAPQGTTYPQATIVVQGAMGMEFTVIHARNVEVSTPAR